MSKNLLHGGMSRRHFIASAGTMTAAMILGPQSLLRSAPATASQDRVLRGFIVSDAHFGWNDPRQPAVKEQEAAIANILERFGNMDLFLDTGDGHHGDAKDSAYGDWTDVIVRGCGPLPMFFTMGNHEADAWGAPWDPEEKTARMGSVGCRPYYSFDAKGIHFLVLPQLLRVNCVNREALEWAALDLKLNADKTVIVLSHNSLRGTTEPPADHPDLAYRVVANSEETYRILNQHPKVIAWMHGHNHDFKIVPKQERVYVSNGRIGGFPPPIGGASKAVNERAHLGGIYFEVHPDRFVVRCYSATAGQFFDEMDGCAHLSYEKQLATSLDETAPFRLSYGNGNLLNGARQAIYQYHAGVAARRLYFAPLENSVYNDNTGFGAYGERFPNQPEHSEVLLPGFDVGERGRKGKARKKFFVWNNPGITLQPCDEPQGEMVLSAPGAAWGQRAYYRVSPGQELGARIEFGSVPQGVLLTPRLRIASNDRKLRRTLNGPSTALETNGQKVAMDFLVPKDLGDNTIYSDPSNDTQLSAWLEIIVTNLTSPLQVVKFELLAKAGKPGPAQALLVNGERFPFAGALSPCELKPATSHREWVQAEFSGAARGVFLVQEIPLWQARNAPLAMVDGALHIGPLRNDFSPKKDVLLVPLQKMSEPFVHRLGGIAPAVVTPFDPKTKSILVQFDQIAGLGEIECVCQKAPDRIVGTTDSSHLKNRLVLKVAKPGKVEIHWA